MRFFEKKRAKCGPNADVKETPSKTRTLFHVLRVLGRVTLDARESSAKAMRIFRQLSRPLRCDIRSSRPPRPRIAPIPAPHRTGRGVVWILVSAPSGNNHVGEGGISPCLPSSLVLARMTYRIFHPRYDPSQARRQRGAPGDRAAADHAAGSRRGWQQPRRRGLRRCWGASAAAGQASPPRPDGP